MARPATGDADPAEDVGFCMTPMIDVVFQLIVFLMLANDMSRREIEDLLLPAARHAREDPGTEKRRLIVNLIHGGPDAAGAPSLRVRGLELDLEALRRYAEAEARSGEGPHPDADLHALVRADRRCRWQEVQWVIRALAEAGVHRLQFATRDPGPAPGGREP